MLWLLLALFAVIVLLFRDTAGSIVSIWHRSNTFAHGYLIPPIAAWLVWRRRARLALVPIRPSPVWILAVAALGGAWLLGRIGHALILEQYAFALLVPAGVAAVFGTAMLRALLFPLGFLVFLGVPGGDVIVPPLIQLTASFALKALQFTGVPVHRSGDYLTLPNGEWVITDACSGFRYLMASLTLGCLYANLRFRTWRNRLIFVAFSLAIPILANGVRAYVIVMLGYLSDMKVAVGVDHFIYGWLLFALFSTLLFWIGSRMTEPAPEDEPAPQPESQERGPFPARSVAVAAAAVALVMAVWPAYAARIEGTGPGPGEVSLSLPASAGEWTGTLDPLSLWKPDYHGAVATAARSYRRGDRVVVLYVAYYRHQEQGSELINEENEIVRVRNHDWRETGEGGREVMLDGRATSLWETRVSGAGGRLLVWHRYWLRGAYSASPYMAQLVEIRNRILTGRDDAALIAVVTPYEKRTDRAEGDLKDFLASVTPSLEASLRHTSEGR